MFDPQKVPVSDVQPDAMSNVMANLPDASAEIWADMGRLFAGIHVLRFGHLMSRSGCFSIPFVPSFYRSGSNWMSDALPMFQDGVPASAQQARLYTAASGDFSVTPDSERAGRIETSYLEDGDPDPIDAVLSYVSPETFSTFQNELDAFADAERRRDTFVSDLAHLECIKHLMTVVFPSPEFQARDGFILRAFV